MSNILFVTLNMLLALTISIVPLKAQSRCQDGQTMHPTGVKQITAGKSVSINFQRGQRVKLSSDFGAERMAGNSIHLNVKPLDKEFLFAGGNHTVQDISNLFAEGENTLLLNAETDNPYWMTIESPCPTVSLLAFLDGPHSTMIKTALVALPLIAFLLARYTQFG